MDNKIANIIRGIVIIALGVLIAVYGGGAVADVYFGVVFLIVGITMLIVAGATLARRLPLPPELVLLGGALIGLSIGIFVNWISMGIFINMLVFIVLGLGGALILLGIYSLTRRNTTFGVIQLIAGAIFVTLSSLYIALDGFRVAFWIITGVVIAVYGALILVFALTNKKPIARKK